MRLLQLLVDVFYILAAVLISPIIIYRCLTTGKYRRGWAQRQGRMPILLPTNQRVWIHAVSVGEINAVRGLVAAWRERCPNAEFVISTTTDTGYARGKEIFNDLLVIRYPLDFSGFVSKALDRIKPNMIVLVELEIWYQFVTGAAGRGIPIAVVNGRLSQKSIRRFGYIKPFARRMFEALSWVGCQDETYAQRFRQMGVPAERVSVTGSLKWDTAQIADTIEGADVLARAMGLDNQHPLWVCGSTGPGEEKVILDAFARLRDRHPKLQLAVVPRKPERFGEVADLIARSGYACIRRSESPDGKGPAPADKPVILGDTMGELRKFYCLADVVFVGRTLVRMGGSDMMEVAGVAKPIIVGPHTQNFADTMGQLERGNAVCVVSADLESPDVSTALADAADKLLTDRRQAEQMGNKGREVVRKNRGATRRTLDALMEIMPSAKHRTA